MKTVTMYTTGTCPFCQRATALLRSLGVEAKHIRIDVDPARREEMLLRTDGARTVPQIFIDEELVGGFDSLQKLHASGNLRERLGL